jgi:hypothetical protein
MATSLTDNFFFLFRSLNIFAQVVLECLNNDNDRRRAAEQTLETFKLQPDIFIWCLLQMLVRPDVPPNARDFSSVILRQSMALRNELWAKLSPQIQQLAKSTLLELMTRQPHRTLRKKIDDIVGCLASKVMADPGSPWPELLPAVLQLFRSNDPDHKATAFRVLDKLAEFRMTVLHGELRTLKDMCMDGLGHSNSDVRLTALTTTVTVIIALDQQENDKKAQREIKMFNPCLPLILQGLAAGVNAGVMADQALSDSLEQVINLANSCCKFLKPHIDGLADILIAASTKHDMDMSCSMALELLLTLGEREGGRCIVTASCPTHSPLPRHDAQSEELRQQRAASVPFVPAAARGRFS